MVKASSDRLDTGFIFITQKARTIKNYHQFLQQEFKKKISLTALCRCAKSENLAIYLHKPDFEELPLSLLSRMNPCLTWYRWTGVVCIILKSGATLAHGKSPT